MHVHSAFHFDEAPFCISSALNILFLLLPSLQIFVCGCGALCSLFPPHSSLCAHVYANEECVSEIKNLLAHISVSRPAILDQPCCFLHIIETSLRLFNLYIRMTYR
uniref:Uncharacterized protein n=1 Tax=Rhipicephalus zambeziensis TaxID=60191 RepID=A0A224YLF4_9ACAR